MSYLDTDAVVGVLDFAAFNHHVADGVVAAAADRADGKTVAAGADAAGEGDIL